MDLMKCWCGVIFGTSDLQNQSPIIFLHLRFIRWQKFPQTIYLSERLIAWLSEPTKNHGEGAFVDWGHRFLNFFPSFPARMLISSTLFGNAAFRKPLSRLGQWGNLSPWVDQMGCNPWH